VTNLVRELGSETTPAAEEIARVWIENLGTALERCSTDSWLKLFATDGYWRDMLSFTWQRKTFFGRDQISAAFDGTAALTGAKNVRIAVGRTPPRFARRSGRNLVEAWFDFDTRVGRGAGFVRLLLDPTEPHNAKAWVLLTTLQALHGFEERVGDKRPTGNEFSRLRSATNWLQQREREQRFEDRDPEVLIVGAGQGGLILAARLRQMGVDVLVIDRTERVGNVWRSRYGNLTLHNELSANHFPYLRFPDTWPLWLPKDMLADWLEGYAKFLELNVWTGTELLQATFDEHRNDWQITLSRPDQTQRGLRCKHLVAAMGVSGGVPTRPDLAGLGTFAGQVLHSNEFKSGLDWVGKRAIVIGTGNSGHDIAQDLHNCGAATVSIMQRGATCVLSLEPSAMISYAIYADDLPVDDVDLMVASIPYPVLIETYQKITEKTTQLDRDLLSQLQAVGFRTHLGEDATGFQLLYLRGAGGYYIDVGCSDLIIERKIRLLQAQEMDRFTSCGLLMRNGERIDCDLVVLATGFESMQESIRRMLGDQVADRVGPVWGFDEEFNVRNMWTRTAQPGLWIMGGAILEARLNSRFLALEIKASLEGLMPSREELSRANETRRAER
jgi:cation diffusion facilitator CzcD-associated flavoprotein CzcO